MNYEKIGEFIKTKRKEMNLTQKELAERINVTDKAISKWERGQGCPDVSLLEVLSKELNISILELLKGRTIENEVIKVTEADDYIKDTIGYLDKSNKDKIKNIFNRLLQFAIVFIVILLAYLNIVQYKYMNKSYEYQINRDEFERVTDTLKEIEENIKIIENNKGILSEEDHASVVKGLKEDYEKINNIAYLQYIKELKPVEYKLEDLRILTLLHYKSNELDILKTLEKYSNKNILKTYYDLAIEQHSEISMAFDLYSLTTESYYYQINYNNHSISRNGPYDLGELNNKIEFKLKEFLFLTELIEEVGGING